MTISGLRWMTLAVWAAVGASALFWGLRVFAIGPVVPRGATAVAAGAGLKGDPTRLLGGAAAAPVAAAPVLPPAPSRFTLLGVISPRAAAASGEGVAVISVDDDPPRAFRVGAVVDGDLIVRRVHARGVEIGDARGGRAFALETPPLQPGAGVAPGLPARPALPNPAFQVPRALPPMPRPAPMPESVVSDDAPAVEIDASPDEAVSPEQGMILPGRPGGAATR